MSIPKYLRANWKLFLYTLFLQLGFFLLGVVMVLIINRFFNEDRDYACMGTLMALCGIIAGGAVQANQVYFRTALLMGRTRRYYLAYSSLVSTLLTLQGWLTAFCLCQAETLLYRTIYPGYESGLPIEMAFRWWAVLLSAAVLCIACLFFGAVQIKFGPKGALTVWLVFCFGCMLLPQSVDRYLEGGASLLAKLGGLILMLAKLLTPAIWCAAGAAALLAMLVFSVWVYLRAEVRI